MTLQQERSSSTGHRRELSIPSPDRSSDDQGRTASSLWEVSPLAYDSSSATFRDLKSAKLDCTLLSTAAFGCSQSQIRYKLGKQPLPTQGSQGSVTSHKGLGRVTGELNVLACD
jgi:hypothetical protein